MDEVLEVLRRASLGRGEYSVVEAKEPVPGGRHVRKVLWWVDTLGAYSLA